MRKILLSIASTILLMLSVNNAISQAGSLDTTFNETGKRLYDHGTLHDNGYGIISFPDTTSVILSSGEFNGNVAGVLYRIKENSDVDSTFGVDDGYTVIQAGDQSFPQKLLMQPDGKFLVTGTVQTTPPLNESFFLARLLPDGSIDQAFGTNGFFLSDYSTDYDNCHSMILQTDGKIVLAGRTYEGSFSQLLFMRINSDGTLDDSFGTNGYTMINSSIQDEDITALGVLSNGTIIGVGDGYVSNPFYGHLVLMAKLTSEGIPMPGFGTNGVMQPTIITNYSDAFGLKVINDSIFITGRHRNASNNEDLFLIKMDSSCVADPAFGANGGAFFAPGGSTSNVGLDILLGGDGKIYNSGATGSGGIDTEYLLVRFMADGSVDNSFDSDGYVTTDFRSDWDEAYSLDMQVDGKIIMTGNSGGLTNSGDNKISVARYLNDYNPFGANFSADADTTCEGSTVNYMDMSSGDIISWNWTFEGGVPATSTDQNPTVTYITTGEYDVTLEVTDGTDFSTLTRNDFIVVEAIPVQPSTPAGPDILCGNEEYVYTINSVQYADNYVWEITPADAGTLTTNDTSATLLTSGTWNGSFTIKVKAGNQCGYSDWSSELSCTLNFTPEAYFITGGGGYCEGGQGLEVILENSQTGVDYELFFGGVTTGTILPGTGNELSFGFQTDEGVYTSIGYAPECTTNMMGDAYVYLLDMPEQGSQPAGPEEVCAGVMADYETTSITNADTLIWVLEPVGAGNITGTGENISVEWSESFNGIALLSVFGSNDCGDGPASDELEITVNELPTPVISGESDVCIDVEEIYSTPHITDNTYVWEVEGGDIVFGAGTSEISVLWTNLGEGYLLVSETSNLNCEAVSDTLFVLVDECTGINELFLERINIYPNPAKDQITIVNKNEEQIVGMIIYDMMGNRLMSRNISDSNMTKKVDINSLANGTYILEILMDSNLVIHSRFEVIK